MKSTLTQSEWRRIRDNLALGTSNEIAAGDTSHIEDHIALSDMTNYFPNVGAGRIEKTGDNEWSMLVGEMTMTGTDEEIDYSVNNPTNGYFMIVPDGFTTASAAPINSRINMYQGPILAYDHISVAIARAERVEALEGQIRDLTTRLEALENPTSPE